MSLSICNNKRGFGLVEVLIAIMITVTGILALLALQPSAWKVTARSDYLGRAAGILQSQLELRESLIMNPCFAVTTGTLPTESVKISGTTASVQGDAVFQVQTTITNIATNAWRVTVTVTWPPINNTGVTESLVVTRQERFRFGCV